MIEDYQDLVRKQGDRVDIHTELCVLWKIEHENCEGCESELGCSKAVNMLGVSVSTMSYEPKDYADFEAMQSSIQRKLDAILNARTTKEVLAINW